MQTTAVNSNSSSANKSAVVVLFPDFFPVAPKECAGVSNSFFSCVSDNSKKISPDDKDAGNRGLLLCLGQRQEYIDCMTKLTLSATAATGEGDIVTQKNNWSKRFRVQQEYQLK